MNIVAESTSGNGCSFTHLPTSFKDMGFENVLVVSVQQEDVAFI